MELKFRLVTDPRFFSAVVLPFDTLISASNNIAAEKLYQVIVMYKVS